MKTDNTILLVQDNPKDVFLIQPAFRKAEIILTGLELRSSPNKP